MAELVHKCIDNAFIKLLEGDLMKLQNISNVRRRKIPDNIHILLELSNVYYILGRDDKMHKLLRKST